MFSRGFGGERNVCSKRNFVSVFHVNKILFHPFDVRRLIQIGWCTKTYWELDSYQKGKSSLSFFFSFLKHWALLLKSQTSKQPCVGLRRYKRYRRNATFRCLSSSTGVSDFINDRARKIFFRTVDYRILYSRHNEFVGRLREGRDRWGSRNP